MARIQKITPCLWFDRNAEEAVDQYLRIFDEGRILGISHYAEGAPLPAGTVLTIQFELHGQQFLALNGGPMFKFTDAISLIVNCENQDEIDHYWAKLSEGGAEVQCGWLKDRYGLSWQVSPALMSDWMTKGTPEQASRAISAVMNMKKIDLAAVQRAFDGV